MDRIHLLGIAARCRVGVPADERKKPQRVIIDATLELDLRRAGKTDALNAVPDYHALENRLRAAAQTGERKLLENLAERLASEALGFDRRIRAVIVRVEKKPAVMPKTRAVAVEITRRRG